MEIAEFMLQNEGADVTKAWNGQEAVELFRNSEPGEFDVILKDIMMPVMNGYEATKMIRSLDREDAKAIPIIAMTANAFTEDRLITSSTFPGSQIYMQIVQLMFFYFYSFFFPDFFVFFLTDKDMGTSSCRLWQAIPDGNLSM